MTELQSIFAQLQPTQIMSGVNATLNVAAIAAVLVVRAEVKALRRLTETLQDYILTNSKMKTD